MTYKLHVTDHQMPRRTSKTGFDKYFEKQMRSPSSARAYTEARAEVDLIDRIMRDILQGIDDARQERGMSKAELARAAGMREEIVRRLFTARETPNPTLETIVRMMVAVGRTLVGRTPPVVSTATRN